MNKTVQIVFVVLGVLFVIVLLIGFGFYLSANQQTGMIGSSASPAAAITSKTSSTTGGVTADTEFTLNDSQKQALSSFGIDPATVPSTISAEQEACFVAELGNARVAEIKAGDSPSAMDFFKAKGCI